MTSGMFTDSKISKVIPSFQCAVLTSRTFPIIQAAHKITSFILGYLFLNNPHRCTAKLAVVG
jgi:hypothetical protein